MEKDGKNKVAAKFYAQNGSATLTVRISQMCANLESELIVAKNVVWIEAIEVQELGAVVVDDGAEAESAPPAGRHVQDVDPGVALRSTSCAFGSGRGGYRQN